MVAFKVENYRPVQDSGWVEVGEISAIIGKNESGKTSLLKALWKFNPYIHAPYEIEREWPRGRRRERDENKAVSTVRFQFTPEERAQLAALDASLRRVTGVEVTRNYCGDYHYTFLPHNPEVAQGMRWAFNVIREKLNRKPNIPPESLRAGAQAAINTVQQRRNGEEGLYRISGASPSSPEERLQAGVQRTEAALYGNSPIRRAVELVHNWLPTFIYMDDYKVFSGTAQLDQMSQRKKANRLTEEDSTVLQIMAMAGLDLDEEVKKISIADKEQRMLDMSDASQTLTEEIAHRWTQKRYEVMFQADGAHFIMFVKDADTNVLVPLEERSKGFQWFFSFDMTFMCETRGQFNNAIILLDEPGMHLHAAAQRDLLKRMHAYAQSNQLIYTTHMPFMVDFAHLDRVYIAEEMGRDGTRVHNDWAHAGPDARFTMQAALGLAWSDQLYADPYNLVVEDVADHWLLMALSELLIDAGYPGLDARLTLTPAGGARNVAYVGAMLQGASSRVAVLLNGVPDFTGAAAKASKRWLQDDVRFMYIGDFLDTINPCTVEDLLSENYYLEQVRMAYWREIGQTPLVLEGPSDYSIVARTARALQQAGIRFNRNHVARQIMLDIAERTLAAFPAETTARIHRLIGTLNALVQGWAELPAPPSADAFMPPPSIATAPPPMPEIAMPEEPVAPGPETLLDDDSIDEVPPVPLVSDM